MIKQDEAIESIRQVRKKISRSLGNDPKKLLDYYQELQSRHPDRIVDVGELPNKAIHRMP